MTASKWQEPNSLEDAQKRRDKATEELFAIDTALGSKTGRGGDAKREVLKARKSAFVIEIRRLKSWMRNFQVANNKSMLSDSQLMRALYKLLQQLQKDGVDLDPDEIELVAALKERVRA